MRPSKLIPTLAAAAALGAPAAADAATECAIAVKAKHTVAAVTKHGITSRITCDAPTRVLTPLGWKFGSPQHLAWSESRPGGTHGISTGRPVRVPAAGVTVTRRSRLTPAAARFIRRFRRTRIKVTIAVERPDRRNTFRSHPGDWVWTTVVR